MADIGKIPPWALGAGVIVVGGGIYLYKRSKSKSELERSAESSTETASEAPYVASVENPAEEFPYSISGLGGVGGGGSGAIGNALESQNEIRELFQSQGQQEKEFQEGLTKSDRESQEAIAREIKESQESIARITSGSGTIAAGSGGGAPSSPLEGGTTAPPPATAAPTCPPAFPNYNASNGPVGAHSCWRWSRTKTSGGCSCHGYQDGHSECEKGKHPNCYW